MNPLLMRWGGRRFLLCLGCGIVCTLLLIFGYLGETVFRDLIISTLGVFVSGATAQKFAKTPEGG